jgi:ATP-dependent RNA helicase SUPV3L1/SUV3
MSISFITPKPADDTHVRIVLGPTNTGKTHLAVERMLGHSSGVIGLPLRLLAREIYDRIVRVKGADATALVTGEEKIVPPGARYWVATVEAMPLDVNPAFLAVDEIQLCADSDRGHVFTDRLLNARGREETMFMGSDSMRSLLSGLLPKADIITRPRFSTLTHVPPKKLSRLPRRSAVIAFSAADVYALAEMLRRLKGGAAVVMGALSPRTRNAQVALYQAGDVDYIVATDAIGMGLNMDVDHVAFASLKKFDGEKFRLLTAAEAGQIAGRAGRHMNDGTFGTVAELCDDMPEDLANAVANHAFPPVRVMEWRNSNLKFHDAAALLRSLEALPQDARFRRAREAEDLAVLRMLLMEPDTAAAAYTPEGLRRLWDACQIPDFRKVSLADHARICRAVFQFRASGTGRIPDDWFDRQLKPLDRVDGNIDTLAQRLAYVRTWTYAANRPDWLDDPAHWQGRARAIEDRLSDALHQGLSQRFVDRRTTVLLRELRTKDQLMTVVEQDGGVTVEGQYIGALKGFQFAPDAAGDAAGDRALNYAATQALGEEINRRVAAFTAAPDEALEIAFADDIATSTVRWQGADVGSFESGGDILKPKLRALPSPLLTGEALRQVEARLEKWLEAHIAHHLKALVRLKGSLDAEGALTGMARGLAYQIYEHLGSLPRRHVAADFRAVDKDGRRQMRQSGIWLGAATLYLLPLVKPYPARLRLLLWAVKNNVRNLPPPPPPGLITVPTASGVPAIYYEMLGYRPIGGLCVRFDMLERLGQAAREKAQAGPFAPDPNLMSLVGVSGDEFLKIMRHLGYVLRAPTETEAAAYVERMKAQATAPAAVPVAVETSGEAQAPETPDAPVPDAPAAEAPAAEMATGEPANDTGSEAFLAVPGDQTDALAEGTPEPAGLSETPASPEAAAAPETAEPVAVDVPPQLFFREEARPHRARPDRPRSDRPRPHRAKRRTEAAPAGEGTAVHKPATQAPEQAGEETPAPKPRPKAKPRPDAKAGARDPRDKHRAKAAHRPKPERIPEDSPFAVLASLKASLLKK